MYFPRQYNLSILLTLSSLFSDLAFGAQLLHKRNVNTLPDSIHQISHRRPRSISDDSNHTPYLKDIPNTSLEVDEEVANCFEEPKFWCSTDTKYRSIDGRCNNLKWRTWGMANTALNRVISAAYKDDICTISINKDFPSPTRLARLITQSQRLKSRADVTKFLPLFAAVVADDLSIIDLRSNDNACCTHQNDTGIRYGELACSCMTTDIDSESESDTKCWRKPRTRTTHNIQCPVYPVNQLTTVSSFLDASFLYSANADAVNKIRSTRSGKLNTIEDSYGRPYPPNTSIHTTTSRHHSHVGPLTVVALFHRLHNFLCDILGWLNPSHNDELLFQEARRLLISIYQHIVYFEFLPIIIGYEYANKYQLMTTKKCEEIYQPKINPSTINSFTTVAFKIFHFLYPSTLNLMDENHQITNRFFNLMTAFNFDESILKENQLFDALIRGSINENLFENFNVSDKLQLFTLDIERTRDHGIPSYIEFRTLCELPTVSNFGDLKNYMHFEDVYKLAELYKDVDDIELYVAAILEKPVEGAIVGPTLQCLIGEAFYRYKYGDRYFYELEKSASKLGTDQLEEIKKFTASLLICISSNAIVKVQSNVFHLPSHSNPEIFCETLYKPNYSLWQEKTKN